jgi:hypothetical protein
MQQCPVRVFSAYLREAPAYFSAVRPRTSALDSRICDQTRYMTPERAVQIVIV